MNTEFTHVHSCVIPIRWGDMDALGHVNNTLYLRYAEILRMDWFFRLGLQDRAAFGPVIVNANARFMRQLRFPGEVLARLWIGRIGRSSVETRTDLLRMDDPDTVHCDVASTVVWIDYRAEKSAPIPEDLRIRLTQPIDPV